jgi:hypothetical protein
MHSPQVRTISQLPSSGPARALAVLRSLYDGNAAAGVIGSEAIQAFVTAGVTYLDKTSMPTFDEFVSRITTNMVGSATKTVASSLKVATTALSATATQGMYGAVITVATPLLNARNAAITATVTWTIDGAPVVQTVVLTPKAIAGATSPVWQCVILALASNGGVGTPAKATACLVSLADGQAGLVDTLTTLSIESLNLRDIK